MYLFVNLWLFTGPPGLTKNITDLKFSTHSSKSYLKRVFFFEKVTLIFDNLLIINFKYHKITLKNTFTQINNCKSQNFSQFYSTIWTHFLTRGHFSHSCLFIYTSIYTFLKYSVCVCANTEIGWYFLKNSLILTEIKVFQAAKLCFPFSWSDPSLYAR